MDLKVENGKIYVQYFPCCDWVLKGSITAIAQQVTTGSGGTSLADAIAEGGLAGLQPAKITAPSQAGFDNATTRQCAKATAMKYVLQTYLTDLRNYLDDAIGDLSYVLLFLASLIFATPLGKLIPTGFVGNALKEFGKDQLIGFIDDFLADEAFWNDFVCQVAEDLSSADEITGLDITTAYSWMLTHAVIAHEEIMELVSGITFSEFQGHVAYAVSYAGCDCDEYLPAGYTPPLNEGSFRFNFMGFGNYPVGSGAPTYVAGVAPPEMNVPVGSGNGLMPKTVYQETQTGGYWNKVHAIYEMSEPVIVSGFKADLVWQSGEPTVDIRMGVMCYRSDTNVWQALVPDFSDPPPITQAIISATGNIPDVTHMAIYLRARNFTSEGLPKHVTISNPRLDGNFAGQGFLELLPGQDFTP
jgi:hypothetical protein